MSSQILGMYKAIVLHNNDPRSSQRLLLRIPQVLGTAESEWAEPSDPTSVVPKPGETVWVQFAGGDVAKPVYVATGLRQLSTSLQSTIDSVVSGGLRDTTVPKGPTGLAAVSTLVFTPEGVGSADLVITWIAPTENVGDSALIDLQGYIVTWSYDGINWSGGSYATSPMWTIHNLTPNVPVQVSVVAFDKGGNASVATAIVPTTTPNPGNSVTAGSVQAGGIDDMMITGPVIQTAASGKRVVIDQDGMRVYGDDGSIDTNFPTDPQASSTFNGEVSADSLTVAGNMKIYGTTNEVASGSQVIIGAGVSAPAIPTVSSTLGGIPMLGVLPNNAATGGVYVGGQFHVPWWSATQVGIQQFDLAGNPGANITTDGGFGSSTWSKISVTMVGAYYYVLAQRVSTGLWCCYKYDGTTGVGQGLIFTLGPSSETGGAIGTDGTDLLAASTSSNQIIIRRYTTAGVNSATYTATAAGNPFNQAPVAVVSGTFDYGATRYIIVTSKYPYTTYSYSLAGSTLTLQVNESWVLQNGQSARTLMWDGTYFYGTTEKSLANASSPYIYRFSKIKWTAAADGTYWVSAAWYQKRQTLGLGAASAGSITITFMGQTTGTIAFDATLTTIQTALDNLSNVAPGDIIASGGPFPGVVTLNFAQVYANSTPTAITATPTGLTGGALAIVANAYQTVQSTKKKITLLKRGWLIVSGSPLPGGAVDSVKFYLGRGTTEPTIDAMWNSVGAYNSGVGTFLEVLFSGTNPVASTTFPASTPGNIVSSAQLNSVPMWSLSGDEASTLPLGMRASGDYAQITTDVASSNSAVMTAITGLSISPVLSVKRRYKLSALLFLQNTTVANARLVGAILESGTQICGTYLYTQVAGFAMSVYLEIILIAPSSGSHTYQGGYLSQSGGSVHCTCSVSTIGNIKIEDIGPA